MKKVLFVATIDGHIRTFHLPYLKGFKAQGWETFVAANDGDSNATDGRDLGPDVIPCCDHKYNICIQRSPFDRRNLRAYKQLKRLFEKTHFDIVHCHTPMGGVLARLAARKYRRNGTKVLYTSHGFHFYRGGPKSSWLTYYPVEKYLSRLTDALITINEEDYKIAKDKFHAIETFLSHGVGYDESRFFLHSGDDKKRFREEYGYDEDAILIIFTAELNRNKNQELLIHMFKRLMGGARENAPKIELLLVGADALDGRLQTLSQALGVSGRIHFLGYRDDLDRLVPMCDLAVSSSKREGLGLNVAEAMACGLPVVATAIRGHRSLICDGKTGFLVPSGDPDAMAARVRNLIDDPDLYRTMSAAAAESIHPYSRKEAVPEIEGIYRGYMGE